MQTVSKHLRHIEGRAVEINKQISHDNISTARILKFNKDIKGRRPRHLAELRFIISCEKRHVRFWFVHAFKHDFIIFRLCAS